MKMKIRNLEKLKTDNIVPIHIATRCNEPIFEHTEEISYKHDGDTYTIRFDDLKRRNVNKELGGGGDGRSVVIEMYDEKTNKSFAVKKVEKYSYYQQQRDDKEQIIETNVLKKIHNFDFIVHYYGYFNYESYIWIVSELMDSSLKTFYEKVAKCNKIIPESILAKIASCILHTIDYLQRKRMMHRDYKPENILINSNCDIKVCDFGEVGLLNDENKCENKQKGTERYKAPEKLNDDTDGYTIKSEIWSLGLILCELANLRKPYDDASGLLGLRLAITNKDAPKIKNDNYSKNLADFVALCLEKDENKRADLETLMNHDFIKMSSISDDDLLFVKEIIEKVKP